MFTKKRQADFESVGTLVGEGITFDSGSIKGCGNVRIDGILFGDVDVDGSVVVGDAGYIKGNINANFAQISGRLEGNVRVTGLLHLTGTGQVQGNIECITIHIEENAVFSGSCSMLGNSPEKRKSQKEAEVV